MLGAVATTASVGFAATLNEVDSDAAFVSTYLRRSVGEPGRTN
jgi:hypothetical protein